MDIEKVADEICKGVASEIKSMFNCVVVEYIDNPAIQTVCMMMMDKTIKRLNLDTAAGDQGKEEK